MASHHIFPPHRLLWWSYLYWHDDNRLCWFFLWSERKNIKITFLVRTKGSFSLFSQRNSELHACRNPDCFRVVFCYVMCFETVSGIVVFLLFIECYVLCYRNKFLLRLYFCWNVCEKVTFFVFRFFFICVLLLLLACRNICGVV